MSFPCVRGSCHKGKFQLELVHGQYLPHESLCAEPTDSNSSGENDLVADIIRSSLILGDPGAQEYPLSGPKTCADLVLRLELGSYLEMQGLARSDTFSDRWRCS